MNKKGFAIVEVLVAFVILTMSISLLTYAQKNFQEQIKRLYRYEDLYTTVLSLKNKIDIEVKLGDKKHFTGKLNGYNYRIDLTRKFERRNIFYDDMTAIASAGPHKYTLYRVDIELIDLKKHYTFYKMKTEYIESLVGDF